MIKRNIIFVIGLLLMPLFWILLNLSNYNIAIRGCYYEGILDLYKDFYEYYKSDEPFGEYDK